MPFDYTAIDLETANGSRGSICQIGMVRIRGGRPVMRAETLVRHDITAFGGFAPINVRIHGINARATRTAPDFTSCHPWLVDFIGADLLVAHNAAFERSALAAACEQARLPVPGGSILCTVALARALLPELPRHKLPLVLAELGMSPGNHHDALADAYDAARVLQGLAVRTGATSGRELLAQAGVSPMDIRATRA